MSGSRLPRILVAGAALLMAPVGALADNGETAARARCLKA